MSNEGRILTGKEAEDEIAKQFRELEARDRSKTPTNNFSFVEKQEESEGEKLLNQVITEKNAKIHKRNEVIKLRALSNNQLFEIIECAKWSRERAFAYAVSVLKDDAKDERMRISAQKAFRFVLELMKKYKIDDDRLMIGIGDIMYNWETQVKQPWDIRDEVLRDNIIDIEELYKSKYNLT